MDKPPGKWLWKYKNKKIFCHYVCDISGWFSRLSLSALQRAHPCSSVISNTTADWAWLWTPEPWMKPTKISSYFFSYASHGSLNTDNKSSFFLLCMKCQWVLNIFYEQKHYREPKTFIFGNLQPIYEKVFDHHWLLEIVYRSSTLLYYYYHSLL